MRKATLLLQEIKANCDEAFQKPRNRTLERYKILPQKLNPKESLRQFWYTLTCMGAKCIFGDKTESLIKGTFIQNMNNKTVQQKLCTEPKNDRNGAFRFAIANEEGINQHRAFEGGRAATKIKNEPVCAVNERKSPCSRCGLDFSQSHLAVCKAKNERCRNCSLISHFARMCKKSKFGNIRGRSTMVNTAGMRRINLIEQDDDQSATTKKKTKWYCT